VVLTSILLALLSASTQDSPIKARHLSFDKKTEACINKYEKQGYDFRADYSYFTKEHLPSPLSYSIRWIQQHPDSGYINGYDVTGNFRFLKLKYGIKFIAVGMPDSLRPPSMRQPVVDAGLMLFPDSTLTYQNKNEIGSIVSPVKTGNEALEYANLLLLEEYRGSTPLLLINSREQYEKISQVLKNHGGEFYRPPQKYGTTIGRIGNGFKVDRLVYTEGTTFEQSIIILKDNIFGEKRQYCNYLCLWTASDTVCAPLQRIDGGFARDLTQSLIEHNYEDLSAKEFFIYENGEDYSGVFGTTR
jgi:hypothetical protein